MTVKERKLNEIHNLIIELYPDYLRVDIGVTYDGLEVELQDRVNIRECSMRRINGEWVEKR